MLLMMYKSPRWPTECLHIHMSQRILVNVWSWIGKWKQYCFWLLYATCDDMWCDIGKSVWSRTCDIFSFLFDWSAHLQRCIVMRSVKTHHMSQNWYFELLVSWENLNYFLSRTFYLDLLWYWNQKLQMFKGHKK